MKKAIEWAERHELMSELQTCYRCDTPMPRDESGTSIVHIDGGYGMFHDMTDHRCRLTSHLCHNCSAELFRWFGLNPVTMSDVRGLHPYTSSTGEYTPEYPCCEYGYRLNSVECYCDAEAHQIQEVVYGYEELDDD